MADKNFTVHYTIDVEASQAVTQIDNFAKSMTKIVASKSDFQLAQTNLSQFIKQVDQMFRPNGKKKDYDFKFNIDTKDTSTKLENVKTLLKEIQELAKGIKVEINPGAPLKTNSIKSNIKKVVSAKADEKKKEEEKQLATTSVAHVRKAQKEITGTIGKINSALNHLERGREINIKTAKAKEQLNEIIALLNKVKTASLMPFAVGMGSTSSNIVPYAVQKPYFLSDTENSDIQKKLYAQGQLLRQKAAHNALINEEKARLQTQKEKERARTRAIKEAEAIRQKTFKEQERKEREEQKSQQRASVIALRNSQRRAELENTLYGNRRKSAVNRLQYMKKPTLRDMPMAYMFNGYMAVGLMKSELQSAMEYANIMETAHTILRVADSDLSSFEDRFDKMAKFVRQIGVETKFTAIEVAGAVKYLSMAGMDIETINNSIRPITNLALIGDNDIAYIADLATNIMAGYDIKSTSMGSVADIIASSVSRSNVNIVEMAESYKMSAGYMRMAGIDFTESASAIGVLGNAGIKGTMSGTTLRAMTTRFAKPTKEAKETLKRLNVTFTEIYAEFGKTVERLKPLATIFEDLKNAGASLQDMQTIFGRIGGNGAMMLLNNTAQLRKLTAENAISHGVSSEIGKVKQETTKGYWYQMTSQFSESFMQGYESLEPQIQRILKGFLAKFKPAEFAKGLASIGRVMLDIVSLFGNLAVLITKNFNWLEPLIFSSFVATKLIKLAGAITNVGVAIGFLGKQKTAAAGVEAITNIASAAGEKGVAQGAIKTVAGRSASTIIGTGGASALFANQVATGNGLIGAGASIASVGTTALAATAVVSALVGALGWVVYKVWKVKEARDAVLEEIESNKKYRFPGIEALHESIKKTYELALITKTAVTDLESDKTIGQVTDQRELWFTSNWVKSITTSLAGGMNRNGDVRENYTMEEARQDNFRSAILSVAEIDGQNKITSAWGELANINDVDKVTGFINNIQQKYGISEDKLNTQYFTRDEEGNVGYITGFLDLPKSSASLTPHYKEYIDTKIIPSIVTAGESYRSALINPVGFMADSGFDFEELKKLGFSRNKEGKWTQKELADNTPKNVREQYYENYYKAHTNLVNFASSLRSNVGGSAVIAQTILEKAGFSKDLYSNEPEFKTPTYDANKITNYDIDSEDGGAGGDYSGTGKLSSATPKQVIVNISNLLSVSTIELLKTKNGKYTEIQDLKEQMAQALIDVVHDFDASWNS